MTICKYSTIIDYSAPEASFLYTVSCLAKSLVLLVFLVFSHVASGVPDPLFFDDKPLKQALDLPNWFKLSFLDLAEDLQEATENNRGLIIYFGRHDCAYCKALLEKNWGRNDIRTYTQRHFDVIAVDVLGHRQVTDFNGRQMTERAFAEVQRANFTPTLLIFDRHGKQAFRLTGYRPPYQFKAVLEYVADNHHQQESFTQYYARAELAISYGNPELNRQDELHYSDKLIDLRDKQKPLLVLFEKPRCHACDVLHGGPLAEHEIIKHLKKFHAVQLDISTKQPIITPDGQRTNSKAWAKILHLDYTPTLMFFDKKGNEVLRVDSVVWFYRLSNVLEYILDEGYQNYPTFQKWRKRKNN